MKETQSEDMRQYYQRFLSQRPCSTCHGRRVRSEALAVKIDGLTIADFTALSVGDAHAFLENLKLKGAEATIAVELLKEIRNRLRFLVDVGLTYLTLDRAAPSLSGGEGQRIRLASQIGSELTGVIYVLDEPSIGLHQRDNRKLLEALKRLRDIGNTVVVVEHDREAMEESDWLVDFGPGAGRHGGEIVAEGTPKMVKANPKSITGQYLKGTLSIETPKARRPGNGLAIQVVGARENNLKNITATFPLGKLICVTGVSGAGKSTLVNHILYPAAARALHGSEVTVGAHDKITGLEHVDKVIDIDQTPDRPHPAQQSRHLHQGLRPGARVLRRAAPGETERLHPGTLLLQRQGRPMRSLRGRRCEDAWRCTSCPTSTSPARSAWASGSTRPPSPWPTTAGRSPTSSPSPSTSRANSSSTIPQIKRALDTLADVGLGYIALGQSSPTLSGGEAQRVKLSRELSKRSTGRTLYILDEPTTGLHFDDIKKLLGVINRLVDAGNTIVVIEHNLDVIKTADWIIEVGPEGGHAGGRILATGTPEQIAAAKTTATGSFLAELL